MKTVRPNRMVAEFGEEDLSIRFSTFRLDQDRRPGHGRKRSPAQWRLQPMARACVSRARRPCAGSRTVRPQGQAGLLTQWYSSLSLYPARRLEQVRNNNLYTFYLL
jgi:hypothetical protein